MSDTSFREVWFQRDMPPPNNETDNRYDVFLERIKSDIKHALSGSFINKGIRLPKISYEEMDEYFGDER